MVEETVQALNSLSFRQKKVPCPLCGGEGFVFLHRKSMPVHQNLAHETRPLARDCPRGDLVMTACTACGFAYNAAFDARLLEYNRAYDNNQSLSPSFWRHMEEMAGRVLEKVTPGVSQIVEVGCGKGDFLRLFSQKAPAVKALGFDPAYEGPKEIEGGRIRFQSRSFGEDVIKNPSRMLICRHVIEHIPEPAAFLASLHRCMAPEGIAFFETPDVEWILRNNVIWDFFYEHCSLFSEKSLSLALCRAGFGQIRTSRVFGGQYLWVEARAGKAQQDDCAPAFSGDCSEPFRAFAVKANSIEKTFLERLTFLASKSKTGLWGAGAKGVTLANLADPDATLLDVIVDINPKKQGRFLAGTGHSIVSFEETASRDMETLVVMNPLYFAECLEMVNSLI